MSSLVLDPLQRVTRFKFYKETTAVMAFCDEVFSYTYGGGSGPYIFVDNSGNPSINYWWYDDVAMWESVYGTIGLKGVAFDLEQSSDYPDIVPLGEEDPGGVSVVHVARPPAIDTLTRPDLRPVVSDYLASGVDPRFYIFVDNSGSMETEDIQPTLDEYLVHLREWRVPYRVIELDADDEVHEPTGLGGEQWLQWLYAPFVGGFNLGVHVAREDWTPEDWEP